MFSSVSLRFRISMTPHHQLCVCFMHEYPFCFCACICVICVCACMRTCMCLYVWEAGLGSGDLPPTQVGVAETPELCSPPPTDTDVCKCSPTHLNLNKLMKKAENVLCESRGTVGTEPNSSPMAAGERKRRHESKRGLNTTLD